MSDIPSYKEKIQYLDLNVLLVFDRTVSLASLPIRVIERDGLIVDGNFGNEMAKEQSYECAISLKDLRSRSGRGRDLSGLKQNLYRPVKKKTKRQGQLTK